MSVPRYQFSKEVEPQLLEFLKVAQQQKLSKNCDLGQYEVWSKLLPPDPALLKKLKDSELVDATLIDLCSDEEVVQEPEQNEKVDERIAISDLVFVVKEKLQTQNDLSEVVRDICECSEGDLAVLFKTLEESLSSEEVYHFGAALEGSNTLRSVFCHNLLMPRIKKEYCEKVFQLLDLFSRRHSLLLLEELSRALQNLSGEETPVILQYLKKLNPKFLSLLMRNFILALERVDDNSLMVIGALLNSEVEFEALQKLVELLSTVADSHTTDKTFGKLLVTIVEALGSSLVLLEQPLRLIIAGHKSVWKSKLEKTFTVCFEDSLLFSQSFRD